MTPSASKTSYMITPLGNRPFGEADKPGNDHLLMKKAELSFNGHLLSKLGGPGYQQKVHQCRAEIARMLTEQNLNLRKVTQDPNNTELPETDSGV